MLIDGLTLRRREQQWTLNGGSTLRLAGIVLLALAVATSSLAFIWVIDHRESVNAYPEFAGIALYLSDIPFLLGLAVWAVGWYLSPALRIYDGPRYVAMPLLAIIVLSAATLFWTDDLTVTGYTVLRRFLLFGLYIVLATEVRHALKAVAIAMAVVALLHTIVSFLQLRLGHAVGLPFLGELSEKLPGYWVIAQPQAFGLGFNPNPVALHLSVASVLAYGFYLLYPGGKLMRVVAMLVVASAFLGILATLSRSAIAGWLFGLLVVSLLAVIGSRVERSEVTRRMAIAITIMVGLAFVGLVAAQQIERTQGAFEFRRFTPRYVVDGIGYRMTDYELSYPIIRDNLARGVGAGIYPQALKESMPADRRTITTTPVHSVFLLNLAELGLVGGIAWGVVVASPAVWLARNRRRFRFEILSIISIGPLLVIMAESFVDFTPLATQDGRVLMWGLLGLWAGTLMVSRSESDEGESIVKQAGGAS